MKIAVFHRLNFGDTELRLNEEAVKQGIELTWIKYKELKVENEKILWGKVDIKDFDGWYFRAVGSELEWSKLLQLYSIKHHITIVDDYLADQGPLRRFKSVMSWQLLEAGINYAKTSFVRNFTDLKQELTGWEFPVIIKLSAGGRHGMGTFFLNTSDELTRLKEKLAQGDELGRVVQKGFLIQEYIPNDGDFRVMTVGYKCVGGFKRKPKVEKMVLNLSEGRSEGLEEVPVDVAEEAEKAARVLGVEIAGTDLVRSKKDGKIYVIEVNEAPQFKVFEKRTGLNIAGEILKYCSNKFQNAK